jgi:hypothetical protein
VGEGRRRENSSLALGALVAAQEEPRLREEVARNVVRWGGEGLKSRVCLPPQSSGRDDRVKRNRLQQVTVSEDHSE